MGGGESLPPPSPTPHSSFSRLRRLAVPPALWWRSSTRCLLHRRPPFIPSSLRLHILRNHPPHPLLPLSLLHLPRMSPSLSPSLPLSPTPSLLPDPVHVLPSRPSLPSPSDAVLVFFSAGGRPQRAALWNGGASDLECVPGCCCFAGSPIPSALPPSLPPACRLAPAPAARSPPNPPNAQPAQPPRPPQPPQPS